MVSLSVSNQAPGATALRSSARMLRLCFLEARPAVLAVSTLRFMTGAALAVPVSAAPDPAKVLQGAAAWVLSIFAIYLFNGVTDVTEDRVNESRRPIARGDLDPVSAATVAAVVAGLAIAATAGLPHKLTWIIGINLVLGYLYSAPPFHLKSGSTGTVMVLCTSGLLSYWGGLTVATDGESASTPTGLIVFAIAATCWMTFVGVPAKDLSDIAGDAAAGRRTIGVTCGERVSRHLMYGAALTLAAALGAVVVFLGVPLAGVCLAVLAGTVAVIVAGRSAARGGPAQQRRPYRAFMATQHLVHITALISNI
ncbi:UbiA family prenyltransferase [Nonomuraea sp. NPDC026600]|uniref:UbiA family prenyltransferase n=1 Tax=Nonomuraea sp. NPDC026600 TaxID=3155363 RepID=UPI0033F68940